MSLILLHLWKKYDVCRLKPIWAIVLQFRIDWTCQYDLDLSPFDLHIHKRLPSIVLHLCMLVSVCQPLPWIGSKPYNTCNRVSLEGTDIRPDFIPKNTMPPAATKSKKLFLASRSKSRSQCHSCWCHLKGRHTNVIVEYACQIWSLYFLGFRSYSEG